MVNNLEMQIFLRELLENTIGTVMIEEDNWNFPNDFQTIPRGYFSDRLKKNDAINSRTALRLMQLFSYLLTSDNLSGKYQKSQAVKATNEILALFNERFDVDVSLWHNEYQSDNSTSRHHILQCLERVLNMCIDKTVVPVEEISAFLINYLENTFAEKRIAEYPTISGSAIYGQAECYIGREKLSNHIVDLILDNNKCYLHGIGGIGKTEVAKDVLKKIHNLPSSKTGITQILWVKYIENNFAISLIKALGMPETPLNKAFQQAVDEVNSYGEHLLLIIDNVENSQDEHLFCITDYLNCKVLITSRCDGYRNLKRISIPALDIEYCQKLFKYYYTIEENDDVINKIIALADYHTVTIELLAKIADTEEMPIKKFYQTLIECGFHIGNEAVAAAHERLHDEDQVIKQLVKLFKVYGCTEEQQGILIKAATIPNIPFLFNQAQRWFDISNRTDLNKLTDRGWIKKEHLYSNGKNQYRYIMHSVIAAAVRAQFIDVLYEQCQSFIYELTLDMKKSVNENDDFKKGLIQFSWSLNDIFNDDFHSENDADFLWALSEIYRDIGFYTRTIPILDQLLNVYTILYGENCIQLCSVWNSKGIMEYQLSHFTQASECYEKCISIQKMHEMSSVRQKIDHARLEINIGKIYLKNDYEKAIPYFDDAYKILRGELGDNHHDTMQALMHKAIIKKYQGAPEETERTFLEIYEKICDTEDRDLLLLKASVAHNLGDLYADYSPQNAMEYFIEAKNIFTNLLSPTNPDTLDVLNSMFSFASSHEKPNEKLLDDMKELLRLYEEIYGHFDPNVAVEYVNIGLCMENLNLHKKAIEHYEEAIKIYKYVYGDEDNAEFAYIYTNIGAVYCQMKGMMPTAIEYDLKAIKILESAYPDKRNLDLANTYSDIADAYFVSEDYEKTEEYLNKAFGILNNMVKWNAKNYYLPYSTLANLLEVSRQYDDAAAIYLQLIKVMLANEYNEEDDIIEQFKERAAELQALASTT
ncbi:MAG: tetratricopeptide repeat protein [Ruminococcus sp.]|nr:tetratricopeptide repeat protein [Ruminococcus sp.]